MKLFDYLEVPPKQQPYLKLTNQAADLIIQIGKNLKLPLTAIHAALWMFHSNAIIMTYHRFDRYIYACGALLVGTKIMECLLNPLNIVQNCRKILRARKNLQQNDQDFEKSQIKSQLKRIFEAEVNIMINVGFDLNIILGLHVSDQYKIQQELDEHIFKNYQGALTSLYKTEVVVLFEPIIISCLALEIVLKKEGRNIELLDINPVLKQKLTSKELITAKKQFIARSWISN